MYYSNVLCMCNVIDFIYIVECSCLLFGRMVASYFTCVLINVSMCMYCSYVLFEYIVSVYYSCVLF